MVVRYHWHGVAGFEKTWIVVKYRSNMLFSLLGLNGQVLVPYQEAVGAVLAGLIQPL